MNILGLLEDKDKSTHLLLANEAIVRGALEAGVHIICSYPGTPSSEIPDAFYYLSKKATDLYSIEYCTNEKVALEVAAGASLAGAQSLVTMKHVGLNVAADPLMTAAYIGLPGGMVILSADDPGCHSSQNEQDNRHFARMASIPCFEPANANEAKQMTVEAFKLARFIEEPVLLRTTTRLNHMRGSVTFGKLPKKQDIKSFTINRNRFVAVPAVARIRHKVLLENLKKAQDFSEKSHFNVISGDKKSKFGVIVSGVTRNYLLDAISTYNFNKSIKILELGITWPLPIKLIHNFIKSCNSVLILEEGDNLLEQDIKAIANENNLQIKILGKDNDLTACGEFSTSIIINRLARFLNEKNITPPKYKEETLPPRPPVLCPGCAHRTVYYAAKSVLNKKTIWSNDIGCYSLGAMPPLFMSDFSICMGSSITAGSGFAKISDNDVVAFIGDSTFFHSGLTGLANAIFNQHNILIVIMDNGITAMTGHQPNPAMNVDHINNMTHIDIENVIKGFGITNYIKVKASNYLSLTKAFKTMKDKLGVRVIIAEEPCVIHARKYLGKKQTHVAIVNKQGDAAEACMQNFACPAFTKIEDKISVDESLCCGCMACLQIAPTVFKSKKIENIDANTNT